MTTFYITNRRIDTLRFAVRAACFSQWVGDHEVRMAVLVWSCAAINTRGVQSLAPGALRHVIEDILEHDNVLNENDAG